LLTFFFLYELTGDDKFDWLGRAVGEAMTEESGSGSEQTAISVGDELNRYTRQIYALSSAFPFVTTFLTAANQAMSKQHNDYLDKFGEREGDSYTLTPEYSFDFNKIRKKLEGTTTASQIVPRSLLVSLVSIFDSFLGRLIGALYAVKPEMMNSSERSLTFAQLLEFPDVVSARGFILEKEVESVLRQSHAEQFKWLENKFNIPLRKDLPSWPTFIELTERRNLFVHTDGVVSSQYLKICKEHGLALNSGLKVGDQIDVSDEYFDTAYECAFEIGVKLAHVLWRKIAQKELETADNNLAAITYELIAEEKYKLAINILDFATCVLKKYANEHMRRVFIVNRAQAYKWSGNPRKANEILHTEDWTATSDIFRLCNAALQDDFSKASELMRKVGPGKDHKVNYKDWPIFKEFRKSTEFSLTYEEIFGHSFSIATDAKKEKALRASDEPSDGGSVKSNASKTSG
jgi:hypothetical protein